ncbi:hypothetical protein [Brevibacterium litoralis]|uniref:hypothetical protein n=1 Tax=Brevibacterium litoralis TaxID=3138935 RepID=UPI0032EBE949
MESEIRLLRSSLLYADKIELVAPSAAWMTDFRPLREVDPDDVWKTVIGLPDVTLQRIGHDGVPPRLFRQMMKEMGQRPLADPDRAEAERLWKDAIPDMKRQADEVFDSVESEELDMALDAGAVQLVSEGTRFEDPPDQQIAWFRDRIVAAFNDPDRHVLLDELTTCQLRDSGYDVSEMSRVADRRARQVSVGTGLMQRLETFPDAPMSLVLEAREELADGRRTYRKAARNLTAKIQSSALDPTLSSDIAELWFDEVDPALRELRKSTSTTHLAWETGKRLLTEGFGIPTLLVGVLNFPEVADHLPSEAGIAAGAVRVASAGARKAIEAQAARRKHDLVYLLDVEKKLKW